jgi:hypothetical protein
MKIKKAPSFFQRQRPFFIMLLRWLKKERPSVSIETKERKLDYYDYVRLVIQAAYRPSSAPVSVLPSSLHYSYCHHSIN